MVYWFIQNYLALYHDPLFNLFSAEYDIYDDLKLTSESEVYRRRKAIPALEEQNISNGCRPIICIQMKRKDIYVDHKFRKPFSVMVYMNIFSALRVKVAENDFHLLNCNYNVYCIAKFFF